VGKSESEKTMSTFDACFERLIGHEGGYTDNPKDPGNSTGGRVGAGQLNGTKYGIAANTYPDEDIKNITLERAKELYRRDYWSRIRADDMPVEIRYPLFDAAVNSGPVQATKWLQRAIGVAADGVIGPKTMAAVQAFDAGKLRSAMLAQRLLFMTNLPAWQTFGRGWARRIADLMIA